MVQLDIFQDTRSTEIINIRDGQYIYISNFFDKVKSDFYFQYLKKNIEWKQEEMNLYGKVQKFPRLTAWYGDKDKAYTFSGIKLEPKNWNEHLLKIKERVKTKCNTDFNSVLLNLYRNGYDSISWHTDAEVELGRNPLIASVSFGGTRKFQLKHQQTNEKIELELENGSLLIMQGSLQHHWKHQIPKTKKEVSERINLTFRRIK